MSDLRFGPAPRNGLQIKTTSGHAAPRPYLVEVWVNGKLDKSERFPRKEDADSFAKEEEAKRIDDAHRP